MNLHKTILKDSFFFLFGYNNASIEFLILALSLRSRRTPISFNYRLASWYVLAYVVPNVLCNSKNC